jgi:long-chain fatty acid transport protein
MNSMPAGKKCLALVGQVAVLASAATPALAGGFDLPDQDAFAIARGMAFVATADNPSAIYFNPAGITQSEGQNLRLGVYGIYLDNTYKSGGRTFNSDDNYHALPQVYYTYSPESIPLSFGLGVYAPFGLSSGWPQDTGFRTLGLKSELSCYTLNPVVAWRICTNLSVGAGLVVDYADVDLRQGLTSLPDNDLFRIKANGWGVSYNLGVLYKPDEQVSLGVSFRGPTTLDLDGQTETEMAGVQPTPTYRSAEAHLPLPLKVISGISFRPTPKWNFEFDADFTDWSALGTVNVNQSAPVASLGIPRRVPLVFDWQSSWYYEFGATRYLSKTWSVSAGYIFNQNSVPDNHYNPVVADMDRSFFSVGVGYKVKRFDFDLAYQVGCGPTRTVSGGAAADGRYDFVSDAIALSVSTHF